MVSAPGLALLSSRLGTAPLSFCAWAVMTPRRRTAITAIAATVARVMSAHPGVLAELVLLDGILCFSLFIA